MDLTKVHLHWRVGKNGKKEYKSYSLARAYREDGKNRKEIVLKIGKLTEEEADQWRTSLKLIKNPDAILSTKEGSIAITSNRAYLDIAVILEVWNSWELNSVFDSSEDKKRRSTPLSALAALLSINRCIDPSTKSQVPAWIQQTALPFLLNLKESEINPSRIFRELIPIENCKDKLSKHLCKKMTEKYPESMSSLFYDLSSTTFTGSRCLLVRWGHCKEGYENHIVLALIVNTKGLPIYWEVLEGGTADATTVTWLLERLTTKLSITIPTMVFDRGMISDDNLTLLEEATVKYITAMDKSQIKGIVKMDFTPYAKMTSEDVDNQMAQHSDFMRLDDVTYCKEICIRGERRYVLCFNTQLFKDQRKAREEQLIKVESLVKTENEMLRLAKKDRTEAATKKKFAAHIRKAKLQSFVSIKLKECSVMCAAKESAITVRSYEGTLLINKKKKLEAGEMDGFWLLVTNQFEKSGEDFIQDTKTVVQPYRDKVIIESSFRDIKSFVDVGPVHVWKADHVKAHYTICVLAHLMNRTLSLRLHEQEGQKTEGIISPERLYTELSGCHLNRIKVGTENALCSLTQPTENQKELLERLDMKHLIGDAMLKTLNDTAFTMSYV